MFGGSYGFEEQCQRIASFRKANSLPRPTVLEVMFDMDAYTCARLNNDPAWCYDTEQPWTEVLRAPGAGCGLCGAKI